MTPIPVSFQPQYAQDTIKTINNTIQKQTNYQIKEVISEEELQKDLQIFFLDTLHFKMAWKYPFSSILTSKNQTFYGENQKEFKIDMMYKDDLSAKYLQNQDYKVVELPYQGDHFSMVILLPNKKGQFSNFLQQIDPSFIQALEQQLQNCKNKNIDLYLPKFKISLQQNISQIMGKMGIRDAFSEDADFSSLCSQKQLTLDDIIHQAKIEVNEQGTEASAYSSVKSIILGDFDVPEFRANNSFLFYIRENITGNLMFVGSFLGEKQQQQN